MENLYTSTMLLNHQGYAIVYQSRAHICMCAKACVVFVKLSTTSPLAQRQRVYVPSFPAAFGNWDLQSKWLIARSGLSAYFVCIVFPLKPLLGSKTV